MRHYLSIDFYNQGEITNLKEDDVISFICFKGLIRTGVIVDVAYVKDTKVPIEYWVECNGKNIIVADYCVIRDESKAINLKASINEFSNGFPLNT